MERGGNGSQGQRKKGSAPADAVQDAISAALRIPATALRLLPAHTMPVNEFVDYQFPKRESHFVFAAGHEAFSSDEPMDLAEGLRTRPLQNHEYISTILKAANDAVQKGAKSLTDIRYPDSQMPVWAATLMVQMSEAERAQHRWMRAIAWIASSISLGTKEEKEVANQVKEMLSRVGWNEPLLGVDAAATTFDLAILFSDDWLGDRIIDTLTKLIIHRTDTRNAQRNAKDGPGPVVGALHLSQSLRRLGTMLSKGLLSSKMLLQDFQKEFAYLHMLSHCVTQRRRLLFIWNVDNMHWILVSVDFNAMKIQIGDSGSRQAKIPRGLIGALQCWCDILRAETSLARQKLTQGRDLDVPQQTDSFSCGLIALTEMDRHAGGDERWSPRLARLLRCRYFLASVRKSYSSVSLSHT